MVAAAAAAADLVSGLGSVVARALRERARAQVQVQSFGDVIDIDPNTCGSIAQADGMGWFVVYVLLGVVALVYMCVVLANICDDYLTNSLEILCKRLDLPEEIAGVSFLALGGSLPELAIQTFATLEGTQIGVATILGSAIFNLTVGVAVVALMVPLADAHHKPLVEWRPWLRDAIFYLACLSLVIFAIQEDMAISWFESLVMLMMYATFLLVIFVSRPREVEAKARGGILDADFAESKKEEKQALLAVSVPAAPSTPATGAVHPAVAPVPSTPSVVAITVDDAEGKAGGTAAAVVGSGAGVRQRAAPAGGDKKSDDDDDDGFAVSDAIRPAPAVAGAAAEDDDKPSCIGKFLGFITWPFNFLFRCTVPQCKYDDESDEHRALDAAQQTVARNQRERWWWATFTLSMLYVFGISFVIMTLVQWLCCVLSLDDGLAGLLVLSVGASLPDCITMGVVAKRGHGVMAMGGLVGSNIFDILVGLGLPWFLYTTIHSTSVTIASSRIFFACMIAAGAVLATGFGLVLSKWRITRALALMPSLLYIAYFIVEAAGWANI